MSPVKYAGGKRPLWAYIAVCLQIPRNPSSFDSHCPVPSCTLHLMIGVQVIPKCSRCDPSVDEAIVKPDIVFFGQSLPEEFHHQMQLDKDECDLLIVIGSSLRVQPVALIPSMHLLLLLTRDVLDIRFWLSGYPAIFCYLVQFPVPAKMLTGAR